MARSREDLLKRLLETFAEEAAEHVRALQSDLETLAASDTGDDRAAIAESGFRTVHTLKGAARAVGLRGIEGFCHEVEQFLSKRARRARDYTDADVELFRGAVEAIAGLVGRRAEPADVQELQDRLATDEEPAFPETAVEPATTPPLRSTPPPSPPADIRAALTPDGPERPQAQAGAGAPPPRTRMPVEPTTRQRSHEPAQLASIRVAAARLDELATRAETLVQPVEALLDAVGDARALWQALSRRPANGKANGSGTGAAASRDAWPSPDDANRARRLLQKLTVNHRVMRGGIGGLLEQARDIRMTPVSWVLDVFPAMVADLAAEEEKKVRFTSSGADIPVDRRILEHIKDPLIHLIRNAVSHGIEIPAQRIAAGKPETALLSVAVSTDDRGWLRILVTDDGAGVDRARVARLLNDMDGWAVAESELSDAELLDALTRSGMSTSRVVTAVSGHGLGMAIVRERVENLDGTLTLASTQGIGTKFAIEVPTTMSLFVGLHVRDRDNDYLVPIRGVVRAVKVASGDLHVVRGRAMIAYDDDYVPVAGLDNVLSGTGTALPGEMSNPRRCVIVQATERRVGLLVDSVVGRTDVVLRTLEAPLVRVRNIAAAAQLRTGDIALVLRLSDLVQQAEVLGVSAQSDDGRATAAPVTRTVLVVDDSPTTRVMERNLLEAAGYTVVLAADGIDALEVLQREAVDVVVSDIDMPRMNGFELTSRIRGDARMSEIPIVLVTALDTPEDKRRGLEAGASAYMVKAQFDESKLLDLLSRVT